MLPMGTELSLWRKHTGIWYFMKVKEIEPATFWLVSQCFNQLRYKNKDTLMRIFWIHTRINKEMKKINEIFFQVINTDVSLY